MKMKRALDEKKKKKTTPIFCLYFDQKATQIVVVKIVYHSVKFNFLQLSPVIKR